MKILLHRQGLILEVVIPTVSRAGKNKTVRPGWIQVHDGANILHRCSAFGDLQNDLIVNVPHDIKPAPLHTPHGFGQQIAGCGLTCIFCAPPSIQICANPFAGLSLTFICHCHLPKTIRLQPWFDIRQLSP